MKKIYLTKMRAALVDDDDYEELSKHRWCLARVGLNKYAVRGQTKEERGDGKRRLVYMHREVLKAKPGDRIAYRTMNTLDNRKRNLEKNERLELDWNSRTFVEDYKEVFMKMSLVE